MTIRTDTDALVEALEGNEMPAELLPGSIYAFKLKDNVKLVDLYDRNLDRPRRKLGRIVVEDAASFMHYYRKHADPNSEVYVDVDAGRVTAILDAHQETDTDESRDESARWGEHELVLLMHQTDAWKRWTSIDRKMLTQQAFADFIDDNRVNIVKPSAAAMLELVQDFQTQTKVTFNSATVLGNGNRRLVFTEETAAGAGAKGQIEVPSVLEIGLAPFEDSQPDVVKARFRYRISGGDLLMGIWLDNADDVRRDAVKTVVTSLQKELGIVVMRGTPA